MTTKKDLLRDILYDALVDLNFNFDVNGYGHENEIDHVMGEVITGMLDCVEDYDEGATNQDFNVRVITKKVGDK